MKNKLPEPVEDKDYYLGEVELDFNTDEPFNRMMWLHAKMRELHLDADGNPLRAGMRERPKSETKLDHFDNEADR